MHLKNGAVLQGGRYRIESLLGQGGFGITYLALQSGLNRKVAIKEFFMKDLCNRDAETSHVSVPSIGSRELVEKFMAKFMKEAQMISEYRHPNIVNIYDVFEENGTAYYVMEYHDGGSLSSLDLPLSVEQASGYIRQIASALSVLHENKTMHLDVKPSNVLLDKNGNAVLIDFGVSKHYDQAGHQTSSTPVGISHGYAPGEQYQQNTLSFSPTTDIYALGATFYKLLTGLTPPHQNEVAENGLPVFPSSVPESVASVIDKAMQPRRKDRPQSIEEFLGLLDVALISPSSDKTPSDTADVEIVDDMPTENTELGPEPSPETGPVPSPKKPSRKWLWWLLALLAAITCAAAVLFMGNHSQPAGSSEAPSSPTETVRSSENPSYPTEADQARSDAQTYSSLMEMGAEFEENNATLNKAREKYSSAKELEEKWSQSKDYGSLFCQDATGALKRVENKLKELTGTHKSHEWVDLGLPSALKWATCNVGASSPEEYGDYFVWGEITTKSTYTENNCASFGQSWGDIGGDYSRDAATANWGGDWRLPTKKEFQELRENCTWEWTTQNGHNGYKVTSKQNGQSIFLPAARWRNGADEGSVGSYGYYWSSTPLESSTDYACLLIFDEDRHFVDWYDRSIGFSVRPVLE